VITEDRPTVGLGDYVRDDYDRLGRVTAIHHECPESDVWLALQEKPRRKEGRWVSVLVHGGGSVTMPDDAAQRVEPFDFENPWSDFYFTEDALWRA